MLKGLPLTYNRDLQEDKEPVFDAVDTLLLVLPALAGMISTMRVNTARLEAVGPRRASRSPPTWPSCWSAAACRSARRTRWSATWWSGARSTTATCDELTDDELAKVSPHLTPDVRDVLIGAGRARGPQGARRHRPRPGRRPARRAARVGRRQAAWASG